jgi:hypothetical protein
MTFSFSSCGPPWGEVAVGRFPRRSLELYSLSPCLALRATLFNPHRLLCRLESFVGNSPVPKIVLPYVLMIAWTLGSRL